MSLQHKDWINYPKPGEKFSHYKGGIYEIITLAKDTRDEQTVVVYKSLLFGSIHVKPFSEWYEDVEVTVHVFWNGKDEVMKIRRFTKIE